MDERDPALEMTGVRIELANGESVIDDIDLTLKRGEILGLVGESGSGKTTTARSVFGYNRRGMTMSAGAIVVDGEALRDDRAFRRARGRLVSYVPQNPGTALNPSLRVARVIEDMIRVGRAESEAGGASSLLDRMGLPSDKEFSRRYPHQLSGGQQQRVCIAAALAPGPAAVVLDEPTTGLDVVTQDRILTELRRLRDEEDVAMLYITHDLAVVAQIADRIAVMYAGSVVEQGPAREILRNPSHPYTRGLLASTPDHARPRKLEAMVGIPAGVGGRPVGCSFAPRCPQRVAECDTDIPALVETTRGCSARCIRWQDFASVVDDRPPASPLTPGKGTGKTELSTMLEIQHLNAEYPGHRHRAMAVKDVSLTVRYGECVALVGESGSGKTTIARVIAGLHPAASGQVLFDGSSLPDTARRRTREQRRRIQIIFQNPELALNPRQNVSTAIARPARVLRGLNAADAEAEVTRLLELVRLPARLAGRYPSEISGGEAQRVAIARALAVKPELLVCDEITSALDVSVQAAVLDVLADLRAELNLAVLFITHDLGVVATIAERVLVLENGSLCEQGTVSDVLYAPRHAYTQRLLAAAPSLSAAIDMWNMSDADIPPSPSGATTPGAYEPSAEEPGVHVSPDIAKRRT